MNYLRQINAFNAHKKEKDLSPQAVALYIELLDFSNALEWPESFAARNEIIRPGANMSPKEFQRSRDELVKKGFVEYAYKQCGNKSEGGVYKLIRLYKEEPAPVVVYPSNHQNEGQNKPQFVPRFEKNPAAYKNNIKAYKQRESESAAGSDIISLAKSKFKAEFPLKDVNAVSFMPVDIDVGLLIKCVKESPGFLLANDALCDFQFCVKHYPEIIAGRYKDRSLFAQPRAAPELSAAADPMRGPPDETQEEYYKRISAHYEQKHS